MRLTKLIANVNAEKPNSFSKEYLTKFVNELEAIIYTWLGEDIVEISYPDPGEPDPELRVPAPYDQMYESWVKAKIDFAHEEYQSYSNNQAQFNADFEDWKAYELSNGHIEYDLPERFTNWW